MTSRWLAGSPVRAECGPLGKVRRRVPEIDTPLPLVGVAYTASLRMGQKALFPPGRPSQCDVQIEKGYL